MSTTGPGFIAQAPMAAPPLYGLTVSAAKPPADELAEGRWRQGVSYWPEGCVQGEPHTPCNPSDYTFPTAPDRVDWVAIELSASEDCSTMSYREDRVERAIRLLRMDTERQLASEFWTGDLSSASQLPNGDDFPNVWLASHDARVLSASAVTPTQALSCLEGYLGRHNGGQQGMIHCTPDLFTYWIGAYLVERVPNSNVFRTFLGTIVVPSPGYPGTGPDGVVGDGNVWAYATDMVRVWLDEPYVPDFMLQIDRANNDFSMIASRAGLAEFQKCRHAGIAVDIPFCEAEAS